MNSSINYNFQFAAHNQILSESDDGESMIIDCLIMHEDTFTDRKGLTLNANREVLKALDEGYKAYLMGSVPNKVVKAVKGLFNKPITMNYQNVYLDHETTARNIVGKVLDIDTREHQNELFTFAKLNILGKENVNMVRLGLWNRVSVGFSYKPKDNEAFINEISFVGDQAVPGGVTFGKFDANFDPKEISFQLGKIIKDTNEEIFTYKMQFSMKKAEKVLNYKLSKLVKEGKISKATSKLLKYDLSHVPFESVPHVERAINTILLDKTNRTGSSVDWRSAIATESFFNNLPEGNKKMRKEIVNKLELAFSKAADDLQVSLGKKPEEINHAGKHDHEEARQRKGKHTHENSKVAGVEEFCNSESKESHMSREHLKRMHSMWKEGKHEELGKALAECLGEDEDQEMSAEGNISIDGNTEKMETAVHTDAVQDEALIDKRIKGLEDKMMSEIHGKFDELFKKISGVSQHNKI